VLERFHRKHDTCARCNNTLGLRSHEPEEEYWGINGKLCKNCYDLVKSDIRQYDAHHISGYDRLPAEIEGDLSVLLFDEKNTIVFSPKKKGFLPLQITSDLLEDCKIITRNESTSMKRRIFSVGVSKTKDKRHLKLTFLKAARNTFHSIWIYTTR